MSQDGHQRCDLLQVAPEVRGRRAIGAATVSPSRGREPQAQQTVADLNLDKAMLRKRSFDYALPKEV